MTEQYIERHAGELPSNAELYIEHELIEAERDFRNVDDVAAKLMAGMLHSGQASPLYSLSSSGAVDYEGINAETRQDYHKPTTPDWMRKWMDNLCTYAIEHDGRGMQPGWSELSRDDVIERRLGELGISAT
jgi:hypothetical protein